MPVTNYISVNGRMLSEITDGVILDYVPDALGSIHSVVDQTATAVKTMRYKPYGEVLSRSGSISDRMYQWVGTYGYRATFNYASSHYVRARHYSQTPGSWTTVDPVWPDESGYGYVGGSVSTGIDPTGKFYIKCPGCTQEECNTMWAAIKPMLPQLCPGGDPDNPDGFADCVDASGCRQPMGGSSPGRVICGIPNRKFITITCDRKCKNTPKGQKRCAHAWKGDGFTVCMPQALSSNCGPFGCLFLHEVIHMAGIEHSKTNEPAWSCINGVPGCTSYK